MVVLRVTQNMMVRSSLTGLQSGLSRVADVQEKLATGKNINRPSDDPTDAVVSMRMRSELSRAQQHVRNGQDGLSWLTMAETALTSTNDNLRRVHELALTGANGTSSATSREAMATEVEQIRAAMLDDANTSYLGRPVFGGVTAGSKAFDDTGTWIGVPGAVQRTVADGVRLRVDVEGTDVFGDGASSVFAELDALATALRSDDKASISAAIDSMTSRMAGVTDVISRVGATYSRADKAVLTAEDAVFGLQVSLSEVEDVDLPAAMVDLQVSQVAYQAALAATAKVVQPSLVDFLR
ncbi:flagellar hook-associated protein FlgL [Nocardioides bruguierae]|uniref:Flagellar hook-associated protein FlgL n=1 Tax=Nocardioides bruguierae TaxID=2945102 RepID=A0A9X2DAT7_9ACTN|nr:flagellar hook-associated protein FlgL [Nocardioides bruguierae]MCL8027647.1 flagellar hook-associated protein FlgL [Nocardioides bruguierae]MCM0621992.1 flagellar hook-associated protein FlgL [Nocardioides bruguierae]